MTTTAGDAMLELQYPKAFANAIAPALAMNGKRFRYVHLTGAAVERDQTKALWFKSDVRKIKVRYCSLQKQGRSVTQLLKPHRAKESYR
jgi:hypothetical protein